MWTTEIKLNLLLPRHALWYEDMDSLSELQHLAIFRAVKETYKNELTPQWAKTCKNRIYQKAINNLLQVFLKAG